MTILVTGAAGFIGYHVARKLAERGERVIGVDNLNDFYGTELKRRRLVQLSTYPSIRVPAASISATATRLSEALKGEPVRRVIHLAAQANVRYALENPHAYVELERRRASEYAGVLPPRRRTSRSLVYASSSSVYGARNQVPFREDGETDRPTSLYARDQEVAGDDERGLRRALRHSADRASLLLRLRAVGPADMAYWLFTEAILAGRPIRVFNKRRDAPRLHLYRRRRGRRPGGDRCARRGRRRDSTASTISATAARCRSMDMIAILEGITGKRTVIEMTADAGGRNGGHLRRHFGDRRRISAFVRARRWRRG